MVSQLRAPSAAEATGEDEGSKTAEDFFDVAHADAEESPVEVGDGDGSGVGVLDGLCQLGSLLGQRELADQGWQSFASEDPAAEVGGIREGSAPFGTRPHAAHVPRVCTIANPLTGLHRDRWTKIFCAVKLLAIRDVK